MQTQYQRKTLGVSTTRPCDALAENSSSNLVCFVLLSVSAGLAWFRNTILGLRETRNNGEKLRDVIENIPGMIMVQDPFGEIELVNRSLLDYLGIDFDDLKTMGWLKVIHSEDVKGAEEAWQQALKNQTKMISTFRLKRFDGTYRWFKMRSKPSSNSCGEIVHWHSLIFDIDNRKRMEDALSTKEHELRLVTDGIPALLASRTASGELVYVNTHTLNYTGASLEELAETWFHLVHPDERDPYVKLWRSSMDSGSPYEFLYRLRGVDGTYRWFQERGRPLVDPYGRVLRWHVVSIDVDDHRRMEEAVRITQAQLSRVSQITAFAAVSGSIAHEINQPLAAVVSNAHACQSWLQQSPPNLERAVITVERILRHGQLAADVVSRIRALFRNSPPAKEWLDVNELVLEVVQLMESHCTIQHVTIDLQLDRSLPRTPVDRIQMRQVIVNLIQNGLEASTPSSGGSPTIQITTQALSSSIVLEVSDQGVGLKHPEKAFEPFFSTKEDGMGMGLAISRSIVEAHNGSLCASPNEPHGTIFRITLPVLTAIGNLEEFAPEEVSIH